MFCRDLWKDSRNLEVVSENGRQLIRRFADGNVPISREHDFIRRLRRRVSFKVPAIVQETDSYLVFEYIEGTRAFNLLMDLRTLYREENKTVYRDLALQLLDMLKDDLEEFQQVSTGDPAIAERREIYPVREKLSALYRILTEILPAACRFEEIAGDLDRIAGIFEQQATVPFRDATPKNIILRLPLLFQQRFNSRAERLETVGRLCRSGEMTGLLSHDNIYHIDFSGCHLLCPEIDDWIALLEHESSAWLVSASKRPLSQEQEIPDLCTRFVRFSRFAGRKLAYRLLNRLGHQVRFALDSEAGYFLAMSDISGALRAAEVIDGRKIADLMGVLFRASSLTPERDYLQEILPPGAGRTYYSDVFPG